MIPRGDVPESTRDVLVRTVLIKGAEDDPEGDRIAVALDLTSLNVAVDNALFRSIGIAILEIIASIAFSLWLANWLLGRLTTLQVASRTIAEGDFTGRVPVEGADEIADTAVAFNTMAKKLAGLVDTVRRETARREVMEGDLRVARQIQDSLQPDACPFFEGHPRIEIEAVEDPIQEVAGDFYDWFAIGDHHVAIVIADVAARASRRACSRRPAAVVDARPTGLEPAEVLLRANEQLSERNREQMFVSLTLLYLDAETGEITAAVAGHPPRGSCAGRFGRAGPPGDRSHPGVLPDARWDQVQAGRGR